MRRTVSAFRASVLCGLCAEEITDTGSVVGRLFVTLVRFDPVYAVLFKTSFFSVRHSPLFGYMQDVYQAVGGPGGAAIGASVDMSHIKNHYYRSMPTLNTFAIVPLGSPDEGVELTQPSGRQTLA